MKFCIANNVPLDHLRTILLDVSNAFGKMSINSDSVRLLGVLVIHENPDLVLSRIIKAFFGKSEFPYEYNILSKSQEIVHGVARIYVDDPAVFSLKEYAEADQEKLNSIRIFSALRV